jgi:hypothetical protein
MRDWYSILPHYQHATIAVPKSLEPFASLDDSLIDFQQILEKLRIGEPIPSNELAAIFVYVPEEMFELVAYFVPAAFDGLLKYPVESEDYGLFSRIIGFGQRFWSRLTALDLSSSLRTEVWHYFHQNAKRIRLNDSEDSEIRIGAISSIVRECDKHEAFADLVDPILFQVKYGLGNDVLAKIAMCLMPTTDSHNSPQLQLLLNYWNQRARTVDIEVHGRG